MSTETLPASVWPTMEESKRPNIPYRRVPFCVTGTHSPIAFKMSTAASEDNMMLFSARMDANSSDVNVQYSVFPGLM